jgi:hypothetical protein
LLTTLVVTVKVVVIEPAGIVTLDPTRALRLVEARETVVPPAGAGLVMDIVPVVEVPPTTGDVDHTINDGMGA